MKPQISLRKALADPLLLGGALPGDTWRPWRTLLIAAMGEPLTDEERSIFTRLTDREREPLAPASLLVAEAAKAERWRRWRFTSRASVNMP